MADFTTWTALKTQLLNDLSNRNMAVEEYVTPNGVRMKARSLKDIREFIEFCDVMIGSEAGDIDTFVQFGKVGAGV